ncbi:sterol desaturase family protein [Phenylobacterium sp.]|uniref:sterol desaturase family protein n=1 Tax=Phenylobacterium sp. TaxID=1871053 RepID=UPI0035AD9DCB
MEFLGRPKGFGLVMLAAIALEIVWRLAFARRRYDGWAAAASFGVAAGNLAAGAVSIAALGAIYAALWRIAPVHWPVDDWRTWIAAFMAVEFAYYWQHRFSHTVRWMWATHSVHHSAEEFTLPAAIRLGWTSLISGAWLMFVPLILAGFNPLMVLGLMALDLHYQFFLHTEAVGRLGPLEWVLNTPRHHRVHHASNPSLLDKNFGGVVIVFDRLFGTFAEAPDEEPLRYGLTHPVGSKNPFAIAFHEWGRLAADLRRARSPREAVALALGRPT